MNFFTAPNKLPQILIKLKETYFPPNLSMSIAVNIFVSFGYIGIITWSKLWKRYIFSLFYLVLSQFYKQEYFIHQHIYITLGYGTKFCQTECISNAEDCHLIISYWTWWQCSLRFCLTWYNKGDAFHILYFNANPHDPTV